MKFWDCGWLQHDLYTFISWECAVWVYVRVAACPGDECDVFSIRRARGSHRIHSEKSRRLRLTWLVSLKVSHHPSPPSPGHHTCPLPPVALAASTTPHFIPLGRLTLCPSIFTLCATYTSARREGLWRVGLYVCNSSFPVGRSGPTRVAPPERQLE